jgi:F-type H+-transporting ATPase subunit gamma
MMAEQLSDIVVQIRNVKQLKAIVTAMRGIAASRVQRGRSLLAGTEAYSEVISRAIGHALDLQPANVATTAAPGRDKRSLILFCAEQGFAGPFSERVLEAVGGDLAGATSMIVGTRGATVISERGIKPAWWAPMTTRVEGIPALANRVAEALYSYVARGAIATADIIYARPISGTNRIDRHSLLPIDFSRFARPSARQAPLIDLKPRDLLDRLAAEYVYAQLCEAAIHAYVAENEAKMVAMMAAKNNTETTLTSLFQREQLLRQEEITTEIVELAAGAEALRRAPT